ncbi:hypothetical protein DC094_21245 [Pelagibaculum spongiae]|uniref:Uncharacterized protein n=1 Tax=Pelagibaculum spongiae TaxID=2080658 RepID=A0A2V1GRT3_9GAMM|nr:hypothetical protein DC094_21245 [Pelagibaculum spongiae]
MRRNFKKQQKLMARGVLQKHVSDGPHTEWLGMPEYWIHKLTVDDKEFTYFANTPDLGINEGQTLVFRYQETTKDLRIEKRSLAVAVDPSEYA